MMYIHNLAKSAEPTLARFSFAEYNRSVAFPGFLSVVCKDIRANMVQ